MILHRIYDPKLAQASYLVGCELTREAIVVDPNRDAEQYLAAAAAERVRITHVTETHIHADFVSGSRELAGRTGAALLLSAEGGEDWQYAFARSDAARLLRDRDQFQVGQVRFDVMHTPGHTPEHLAFMVTDTATTDRPMGVFTGDFVFVGDVGRPDLLERAARVVGSMEASARQLHASLQRFKKLPDHLQLWPGHGAGSACGKSLGAVPQTTLGYERLVNWGLIAGSEEEFVAGVLAGQPEPPRYFAEMKRVNREGPRVLGHLPKPPALAGDTLRHVLESGAIVLDTRSVHAFGAGHVPGTINIPLNRSFTTWAGWLIPYDRDFYLIAEEGRALEEAVRDLALIGLDRVHGWFGVEAVDEWKRSGGTLETVTEISSGDVATRLRDGGATIVDVRNVHEWEAGHLEGAHHIPLGELPSRIAEIPRDRPIVLHCQGGTRSAIAASLLQAEGVEDVLNLAGGFAAWKEAGLPVEDAPKAKP